MSRLKKLLIAIFSAMAMLAITACGTVVDTGTNNGNSEAADTVAPVISVEGELWTASVTAGLSYTLPLVTATDDVDGEVEVTLNAPEGLVVDGVFTCTEVGDYEITYTAVDEAGNVATQTLTITVLADTTAPVITIEGGQKNANVGLNVAYTLPLVTAIDDVDGEVEVTLDAPEGLVVDGVFTCAVVGDYEITYTAVDEAGNVATETFTITVKEMPYVATMEEMAEGFTYDWSNKFMNMTSGERVKVADITSNTVKSAIQGASEGFSDTVMHLTGGSTHDLTAITKALGNLKGGYVYTFEIWYYGVSTASDYFIAYNGSGNRTFLGDPFQNGLKKATLVYESKKDETGLTFFTTSTMNVYLGNMTITCEKAAEERSDYYEATHDEMLAEGGYTYDWSENNILEVNNNVKYLPINSLDEKLQNSLNETGAFKTGYVMRYSGQGGSFVTFLSKNLTPGNLYTITFNAYVKTAGSVCVLLMNSAGAQASRADYKTNINANGTTTYTASFTAKEAFANVSLYIITSCEMYVASINFKEEVVNDESIVERTDYHALTFDEVNAKGGYTFDLTEGNAVEIENNAEYREIAKMPDDIKNALLATGAFTSGYALKLAGSGSSFISAINRNSGVITTGYTYTVSFNAYQSVAGGICMLLMSSGRVQAGRTEFTITPNANGTYNYVTTFEGDIDYYYANIYIVNMCELYISDMTVSIYDASSDRTDFYAPTYSELRAEGGYTWNWAENNIIQIESNARYVALEDLDESVKTTLDGTGAFNKGYVLRIAGTGSSYISCMRNNLVPGNKYRVSFNAYEGAVGSITVLVMGGQQVAQCDFTLTKNANGTTLYETTIEAKRGYLSLNLFMVTACDLYLADFNIAIVEEVERDTVTITEENYLVEGCSATLDANGYAGSNAIKLTPSADNAGVWVTLPALTALKDRGRANVAFKLMPISGETYANVSVYDGVGNLVDYAYPSGGWSSVNFDTPIVEKNGLYYVYISFKDCADEVLYLSEVSVKGASLAEQIFGGATLIQIENANTQMNGYVMLTEGKVVVFDGGDTADASTLYEIIKANGGKVDSWFISHYHIDHVNALISILNGYDVTIGTLYYDFSATAEELSSYGDKDNHTITDLANAIKNNSSKVGAVVTPKQKDTFVVGGITIKVLNDAYFGSTSNMVNNSSIVYKVQTAGEDIVFFADLGSYGDTLLMDDYFVSEIKTCTVVQMAHHGQTGVSDAVYKAIDEIKIALYPAPAWLYDNNGGKGVNTATYGTLLTRALLRELGVSYSYSAINRVTIV